jgi:gamma-butyrobetaine dioxygenase
MQNETLVTVQGKRFHYTWLRDRCLCSECYHQDSSQKIYDISLSPLPVEPEAVEETSEELRIVWKGTTPHQSVFPIEWLLEHSYDPAPSLAPQGEVVLWDRPYLESNPLRRFDATSTPFDLWAQQLTTLGFAVVHNLDQHGVRSWFDGIGPLHMTEYGATTRIRPTPEAKDLALSSTGESLLPHTDGSYRWGERLLQFLYSHHNSTVGGDSILIDGFRVARDFREDHPSEFELLASTEIQFRQYDRQDGYLFRHTTPLLVLGNSRETEAVYYCPKNIHWQLPFDQVAGYYQAYSLFSCYLNDPLYQYRFRLESGNCVLFQNFRVLHSRSEYDPASGSRDFETGYIDWSYVAARMEYLRVNGQGQLSKTGRAA